MLKWYLAATTEADIDQIFEIERYSFEQPWSRASFLEELICKKAVNYVVKSGNSHDHEEIVAYIFFHLIEDEMHLLKIAVTPEWRCQGLAVWLLGKSFSTALEKDVNTVSLEVRPSNKPAITLYKKLGFVITGKRPNYYSEAREDAMVLTKNLKEKAL